LKGEESLLLPKSPLHIESIPSLMVV